MAEYLSKDDINNLSDDAEGWIKDGEAVQGDHGTNSSITGVANRPGKLLADNADLLRVITNDEYESLVSVSSNVTAELNQIIICENTASITVTLPLSSGDDGRVRIIVNGTGNVNVNGTELTAGDERDYDWTFTKVGTPPYPDLPSHVDDIATADHDWRGHPTVSNTLYNALFSPDNASAQASDGFLPEHVKYRTSVNRWGLTCAVRASVFMGDDDDESVGTGDIRHLTPVAVTNGLFISDVHARFKATDDRWGLITKDEIRQILEDSVGDSVLYNAALSGSNQRTLELNADLTDYDLIKLLKTQTNSYGDSYAYESVWIPVTSITTSNTSTLFLDAESVNAQSFVLAHNIRRPANTTDQLEAHITGNHLTIVGRKLITPSST